MLRNPYHADALVKIGRTRNASEQRAAELTGATGVPYPFEVLYEEHVHDAALAERMIHRELQHRRVHPRREFFRLPLKEALRCVLHVAHDLERISRGAADPRLFLLWKQGGDPQRFARLLARVLEPHRGGSCKVHLFYSSARAKALLELGSDWSVRLSLPLLRDLKRVDRYADWSVVADKERILARLMPERATVPLMMLDY